MKVLYIINGIGFASNVSLGGSDKRALEIGRRLLARGHKISVLTTESGWQLFKDVLNVEYFIIKRPAFLGEGARNTRMGRVMAYCYACAMSNRFVFKDRFDIVFPTSDFSLIFFRQYRRRCAVRHAQWFQSCTIKSAILGIGRVKYFLTSAFSCCSVSVSC